MNFEEYVPLAVRTEKPLEVLDRFVHSCLGLITELGEVTSELKRMAIYEKPLDEERKVNILEEIGDVMWYVAIGIDATCVPTRHIRTSVGMQPPSHTEGMYASTAMLFGDHCGRICSLVQKFHFQEIKSDQVADLLASYSMIIAGLNVLAVHCGSTLDAAMAANIQKLRIRYPEKYSNEAAEGRADKAGVDARNS